MAALIGVGVGIYAISLQLLRLPEFTLLTGKVAQRFPQIVEQLQLGQQTDHGGVDVEDFAVAHGEAVKTAINKTLQLMVGPAALRADRQQRAAPALLTPGTPARVPATPGWAISP